MKYVEGKAYIRDFSLGFEQEALEIVRRGIEDFIDTCIKDVPLKARLSYLEEHLDDIANFSNGVGPRTNDPLNVRVHLESFNNEYSSGIMFDMSLSNMIKGGIDGCDVKRVKEFRDALFIEVEKLDKVLNK